MDRKSRTEQSPFAIKDVLVSNSANNTKHGNLLKKDKTTHEITYPVPYIKEHFSKETKCKYETILVNMLVKRISLCYPLTNVMYAGKYHTSRFENREHVMFCLKMLDLSDEP